MFKPYITGSLLIDVRDKDAILQFARELADHVGIDRERDAAGQLRGGSACHGMQTPPGESSQADCDMLRYAHGRPLSRVSMIAQAYEDGVSHPFPVGVNFA